MEEIELLFNEIVSAPKKVNKLKKLEDPEKFAIPCTISWNESLDALCNIRDALSNTPKVIAEKLGVTTKPSQNGLAFPYHFRGTSCGLIKD